jgi:hypothetical protein
LAPAFSALRANAGPELLNWLDRLRAASSWSGDVAEVFGRSYGLSTAAQWDAAVIGDVVASETTKSALRMDLVHWRADGLSVRLWNYGSALALGVGEIDDICALLQPALAALGLTWILAKDGRGLLLGSPKLAFQRPHPGSAQYCDMRHLQPLTGLALKVASIAEIELTNWSGNAKRQARGLDSINGVWLFGNMPNSCLDLPEAKRVFTEDREWQTGAVNKCQPMPASINDWSAGDYVDLREANWRDNALLQKLQNTPANIFSVDGTCWHWRPRYGLRFWPKPRARNALPS